MELPHPNELSHTEPINTNTPVNSIYFLERVISFFICAQIIQKTKPSSNILSFHTVSPIDSSPEYKDNTHPFFRINKNKFFQQGISHYL